MSLPTIFRNFRVENTRCRMNKHLRWMCLVQQWNSEVSAILFAFSLSINKIGTSERTINSLNSLDSQIISFETLFAAINSDSQLESSTSCWRLLNHVYSCIGIFERHTSSWKESYWATSQIRIVMAFEFLFLQFTSVNQLQIDDTGKIPHDSLQATNIFWQSTF